MIFYLVHTAPLQIVGTQADARQAAKPIEAKYNRRGWEQIDIPTDKAGLMAYVNELYRQMQVESEANDIPMEMSSDECAVEHVAGRFDCDCSEEKVAGLPSYVHQSVAIDEEWAKLPLERKLHFASLAMEDARSQL